MGNINRIERDCDTNSILEPAEDDKFFICMQKLWLAGIVLRHGNDTDRDPLNRLFIVLSCKTWDIL